MILARERVDTTKAKTLNITIEAQDEAGNKQSSKMDVVLNPIHVTRENPHPLIYDGEYATISLKSFKHGTFYGESEYQVIFEIENKMDNGLEVFMPSTTSINDYQVSASYIVSSIAPGKKGTMESLVSDKDIPDSIGDFDHIDTYCCLLRSDIDDRSFFSIPMILDTNAIE